MSGKKTCKLELQKKFSLIQDPNIPIIGVAIGALVTAVIQSSSATSVIAIGLVYAGVLSFKNLVGIIFGCNLTVFKIDR